jgi:serine/threonine protein kinase
LFFLHSDPLALLTEYCGGGALDHHIRRHAVNGRQLLLFANDIISGLAHLHAHGVVHRDLAARNILLTRKPHVLKVADFGLARPLNDDEQTTLSAAGPVKWQPPEVSSFFFSVIVSSTLNSSSHEIIDDCRWHFLEAIRHLVVWRGVVGDCRRSTSVC